MDEFDVFMAILTIHKECCAWQFMRTPHLSSQARKIQLPVVNLQNGRVTGSLAGHTKSVEYVRLSSMLPLAATGGMDGKLLIWDLQSLTLRSTCEHEDGVVKIIWASSSHLIYTGCLDAKVRIWDSRTGNIQRILQGHQDSILDLAVSRYIFSTSDDGKARAYDVQHPS